MKLERSAGILMHITSLPSSFGIGDLGPQAYKFADFLIETEQSYWQILPLNPTDKGASHSPYSSYAAMAGNILLISPEILLKDGLIAKKDLEPYYTASSELADFDHAIKTKKELLERSYVTFIDQGVLQDEFRLFVKSEDYWLEDYALYKALKQHFEDKPWYQWSDEYKLRDKKALTAFSKTNKDTLRRIKWEQFLFSRQWKLLKSYCNSMGLELFGDLPFYVSQDSVDVWANKEIFDIDKEGQMIGVAGVPPDYFNADGQLWGMPVFKWDVLKKSGYTWWIQRIKKNIELFDILRLDHFRAFADFWKVQAGEETAVNGKWVKGPGKDIFEAFNKALGEIPFIAEDLGDIDDNVYKLRDTYEFPGMKVVQFAFGDDISTSAHIPHNYTQNHVAYTGTHDNNTTVGWYKNDIGETERRNLNDYLGLEIDESNVHKELIRLMHRSVAQVVIIPLQDLVGLDREYRMNKPATTTGNWSWRLKENQLTRVHQQFLKDTTELYKRAKKRPATEQAR